MKYIFSLLLIISFSAKSQIFLVDTVNIVTVHKCPIDTIKGIVLYTSTSSTYATITEGYFIAPCGGYQIGNFYGYENVPTFIPAYFIRNDTMIGGKRQVNTYERQKNNGYFTDNNFKRIPFEGVYGLIVMHLSNRITER